MNRSYTFVTSCGSTNTALKETVRNAAGPVFDVLAADYQTGGRGRRGNAFFSPAGGLYFSAAYPLTGEETNMPFLTLLAGLSAAEALEAAVRVPIRIKWPNDLYLNGRKLGGILTELVYAGGRGAAVVGFGVNLSLQARELPPALIGKVTSLSMENAALPEKKALARAIVTRLDAYVYTDRALCGDTAAFAEKINERAYLTDKRVTVCSCDGTVTGTVTGVAPDGRLKLRTAQGETLIGAGTVMMND